LLTPSMVISCYDYRQSHKDIEPFMSLVRTCFPVIVGRAIPLCKLRTHLDLPIRTGSPETRYYLPSGKNSTSKAGGVRKLTFIGFRMRTSC